jgi:hypothetical protein
MAFIYTRAQLKTRMNAGIHGKIGMLIDEDETVNNAVREVAGSVDLRSARRRASLSPNLFNGIFDYACPADLKAYSIIDIPALAARQDGSFNLVPTEEFEIKKAAGAIAIDDYNNVRILKINSKVNDKTIVVAELDSILSGGGTWVVFGDAANLAQDTDDFIKGGGSLKWDISSAGGTTAGIQNSSLNMFDITDYLGGNGALFVFFKINSTTNLTNMILRIGSSTGNYYQKTITAQADGTAFVNGWNLLKFDLTSLTEVGTPVDTECNFAAVYMTKTAGKVSETDYKLDWMVLKKGVAHYTKYYSKYGWTTSGGTWLENSTDDADLVVADTDEFDMIVQKAIEIAAGEVDEPDTQVKASEKYIAMKKEYESRNPSEAKIMTSGYYDY